MTLHDLFRSTGGFHERETGVFDVEGLDFEGWVTVANGSVTLIQEVPMLNATVEGRTVAPVVEEGWRETFERRVVDVTAVSDGSVREPELSVENERIRVETAIQADEPSVAETVRHAANFVEATWAEGIIPGYEYDERVQRIRERTRTTGNESK